MSLTGFCSVIDSYHGKYNRSNFFDIKFSTLCNHRCSIHRNRTSNTPHFYFRHYVFDVHFAKGYSNVEFDVMYFQWFLSMRFCSRWSHFIFICVVVDVVVVVVVVVFWSFNVERLRNKLPFSDWSVWEKKLKGTQGVAEAICRFRLKHFFTQRPHTQHRHSHTHTPTHTHTPMLTNTQHRHSHTRTNALTRFLSVCVYSIYHTNTFYVSHQPT